VEQFIFEDAVIDNFAPVQEQKLWKGANEGQRYWINKQFWKGDGYPIFVFLGGVQTLIRYDCSEVLSGEGAESCSRLGSRMYLYSMAEEYSALLVDIEHRFYGESWPTVDMDNEHLRYLSSEQALADAARLISYLKDTLPARSSKVVTVGGSYPGNLAAWFRLKYPHITVGSIASSAPVLAQVRDNVQP
jgi:pimeloyl-ACP methyl ester carboxylesterase